MSKKFFLKDQLFNTEKVNYLAQLISQVYPEFQIEKFTRNTLNAFPKLELKARITCIRKNLELYLPDDFETALKIIIQSLPKELDPNKTDDDFGDFIFAPLSNFVATNGLQDKYLNLSFNALSEITKRFSCEDAIRYFINQYPIQSFVFMQQMARSDNYHQRRLASEGLRPKLPWCIGIFFDYKKAGEILDILYFDTTQFVIRSVANHLNDISKMDEDFVIQILQKWQKENKQKNNKAFAFLNKHALRTLIKKGSVNAFNLLGFNSDPKIKIDNFLIKNKQICLNDYLDFSFNIKANNNEKLIIDYKITYPTVNSRKSEKVFKIKQIELKNSHTILIQKKHLFKRMSTKKLYSGKYKIQLQINGKSFAQADFQLEANVMVS